MPISFETYARVALEDPDAQWELDCGRVRQKPPMTIQHDNRARFLAAVLLRQLDPDAFLVDQNSAKLRVPAGNYYIPDLCVIPLALALQIERLRPQQLGVFEEPLPLVVEVWSPSTGSYDVATKLPAYRERGDAEIWFLHPVERWLLVWRRQSDGRYTATRYAGAAVVAPPSLPGVEIRLAALFA